MQGGSQVQNSVHDGLLRESVLWIMKSRSRTGHVTHTRQLKSYVRERSCKPTDLMVGWIIAATVIRYWWMRCACPPCVLHK